MPAAGGAQQCACSIGILGIHIGSFGEQQLHRLEMAIASGRHQRSESERTRRVHVGALLEERLDGGDVALSGGIDERPGIDGVPLAGLRPGRGCRRRRGVGGGCSGSSRGNGCVTRVIGLPTGDCSNDQHDSGEGEAHRISLHSRNQLFILLSTAPNRTTPMIRWCFGWTAGTPETLRPQSCPYTYSYTYTYTYAYTYATPAWHADSPNPRTGTRTDTGCGMRSEEHTS